MQLLLALIIAISAMTLWQRRRGESSVEKDDDDAGLDCSVCGYDLRSSRGRCPECGTPFRHPAEPFPLRDDWPATPVAPRTPGPGERRVAVHNTRNTVEASLLVQQLCARGIAAVDAASAGGIDPVNGSRQPVVHRVVVWDGDQDLAEAMVARLLQRPQPSVPAYDGQTKPSPMRLVPLIFLALTVAATANAGVTVHRIAVDAHAPAAAYGVDLHDLTLSELLSVFRKKTGLDITLDQHNAERDDGPTMVYDLAFTGLSADAAYEALGRAVAMGVERQPGHMPRLDPSRGEPPPGSGSPAIEVESVGRAQSAPPLPTDGLTVHLRVRSAGRTARDGPVDVRITEATDDKGRTLTPGEVTPVRGFSGHDEDSVAVNVPLSALTPRPERIATLRGTVTVQRPLSVLQVVVDKFDDAEMHADFAGGTITLEPPTEMVSGYGLAVRFDRGAMPPGVWDALKNEAGRLEPVAVTAADGKPLRLVFRKSSTNDDQITITAFVTTPLPAFRSQRAPTTTRANGRQGPPVLRPAGLHWDVVSESGDDTVQFDLKDIPVP